MRVMALVVGTLCMSVQFVSGQLASSTSSIDLEVLAQSDDVNTSASSTPLPSSATSFTPSAGSSTTPASKSRTSFREPTAAAGAADPGDAASSQQPHLISLSQSRTSSGSRSLRRPLSTALSHGTFPHTSLPQHPRPPPTPVWHPHKPPARSSNRGGMIAGIVFGVLGGIAGFFALFALGRCLYSWRRTPGRDRIRATMERHYLEREMQEREREDIERRVLAAVPFRRRSLPPPPPPYQHAPAYEQAVTPADASRGPTPPPPPTPTNRSSLDHSPPSTAPIHDDHTTP